MGGEITWECNGSNQYIFTVKIYRDCNGNTFQVGQSLLISNYPNVGNTTIVPITRPLSEVRDISATCGTKPCNPPNTLIFPAVPGAVEEHIYRSSPVTLNGVPGAAGWIFTWDGFARNNAIDNLVNPGGEGLTLRAKMFAFNGQNANTCYDESPKFSEAPASILCIGSPFTYNHNAEDPELDSLVYSWAQPLDDFFGGAYVEGSNPAPLPFVNGYSFTSPFPGTTQNPNNIPASLNTATGEISYQSFTPGEYISVIRVESFRCGIKTAEIYRDIQTVLLGSCSPNRAPVIVPPFQSTPGINDLYRDTVKAGDLVTFNVQAFDQFDATLNPTIDSVYVYASGRQFGSNFTNPNAGCSTPPCAVFSQAMPAKGLVAVSNSFSWQTTCDHIANNDGCVSSSNTYNFVIRAVDNSCPAPAQRIVTISITVLAEDVIKSPDIHCLDVKTNGNVDLTWNQPIDTSNSFNAWMIFSSLNPNGPFTVVDSIFNYNTLSYTHVGAGANTAARYYYIRSRSGCNDAILTPAKDTLSTIFLNTTLDAANSCANLSWNPFNSLGTSGNYRIFRNGVQVGTTNSTTTTFCSPVSSCTGSIVFRVQRDNTLVSANSSSNVFTFNYTGPTPVANFSFVASCSSKPVVFTDLSSVSAGVITSWAWNFGDGSGTSTQQNPSYTYATAGTYTVSLTVTTNLNCTQTTTKQVTVTNSPPVSVGVNKSICRGGSTTIGGAPTTLAGNTVLWSPAAGLSSTSAFNPTASPTTTTTYTVVVSDASSCTSTGQVTVTVTNIPTASAGLDKVICAGATTSIGGSPTSNSSTATYLWSPATGLSSTTVANPTANPTSTTTYTVRVSDGPNCTATDQVLVTVNPAPPASAGADKTICTGGSTVIGGSPTTTAGNTVTWSPATGLSSTTALNPTANPTTTTTYTVTVRSANNCTSTDQVIVTVNPNATANAGADKIICVGGSVPIGGSPTGIAGSSYSWSPATGLSSSTVANPTASPTTTTNYTVTVTNSNGCTGTDLVRVTVNPTAAANAGPDKIICVGVGQVIGGSPTGNAGSSYLWSPTTGLSSPTIANPTANPVTTTTYTVLVTDGNGCTGTDQVLVSIGAVPSVSAGPDKIICAGKSTTIGGSPTGAATSTFSWSPAAGLSSTSVANPTASPTSTQTYTVIVTDAAGCTATDQMIVTVNPGPTVNAGADKIICVGGNVAIGGSPTGPGGSTFTWSPATGLSSTSAANPTASPAATTTYTVSVIDANGCTGTDQVLVTVNPTAAANAGPDKIICVGVGQVIGGSPTGNAGSTYLWSPTTGLSSPTAANPTANPATTTTYTVLVTDGNGCTGTDQVQVSIGAIPSVSAGPDRTICVGKSTAIGGSPTGAATSTFSWSPATGLSSTSVANPTASPTSTQTYTVIVTDAAGCTATDQMIVTVNPSPTANAGTDKSICPGGSIAIGGSPTGPGGSSYSWSPAGTLSSGSVSNPTATPLVNTIYTVTVTNANGCTATDAVEVRINAVPTADAGTDKVICNGASTVIGGSPTGPTGATYTWSPATGLSSTTASNPTANPTVTTNYTVTVTSGVGCSSTDVVRVTVNPNPIVDAGTDKVICNGKSVAIGGSPTSATATSYSWTPIAGLNNATVSNPVASPTATTTYTVVAIDANGCSATDQVLVTVNASPTVSAGADKAICPGGSVAIGGSPTGPGGSSYSWSPAGTLSNGSVSNPIASPLVNTIYTVTVTDANGCTATDDVEVTINAVPTADAGVDKVICNGSNTTIGGSPTGPTGATFAWSPATGLSSTTASNPTANPTVTTNYTVTVTSGVGCTSTDIVRVTVNPNPIVDAGTDKTICVGFSVAIGGSPTSATATSYSWTPAASLSNATLSNPIASPLVTTTYTVVATDVNGCTASDQVIVNVNLSPTVSAGVDKAVCPGGSVAIGGSPTGPAGSSFAWSPAATLSNTSVSNPVASPIVNTIYTVTVTDANGCTATDDVEVIINPLPTADAGTDQTICNGKSTTIGGSPTGPIGATYSWSPATGLSSTIASNPTANPITTTDYTVTVTSGVGCTSTDVVRVIVNPNPIVDAGTDKTICAGFSATIGGAPTSATATSFAWTPAATLDNAILSNPTATPLVTTTYTVVATDANGCTATDQVIVNVNQSPVVSAGADKAICIGGNTTIGGSPTGPVSSTYSWSPAATLSSATASNPTATPLITTTYTVTVTDGNGCISTDDVIVTVNPLPTVDAGADQTICAGQSAPVGGTPTGPAGSTYLWSPIAGLTNFVASNPFASPAVTTTYTVQVTDLNGCTASDQVTITVNPLPVVSAGPDVFVCLNDTVIIGGAPTGPANTVTYAWSPAATLVDPTVANPKAFPTTPTTYTVTVTDVNGCTATDDVLVSINPLPTIDAGDSAYVCPGFSTQLQATGGVTYTWDPHPTLSNLNIANPIATPTASTTYYVTGFDGNGCRNRDSVFVLYSPSVPTEAGADQTICLNDSVTLGGNPTSPLNTTYSWTPVAGLSNATVANPKASPAITTKYYLRTANDTCVGIDSVIVTVNPIITAAFSSTTICLNDTTAFTDLSTITTGGTITNWSWDFGDASPLVTAQNPKHLYLTAGTFNVKLVVTSDVGCKDSITNVITVHPNPTADAGPDFTICFADTINIGGSPTGNVANTFAWSPITGLSNATLANPDAFPIVTTKYYVTVTDGNGCFGIDSMVVTVNPLPIVDAGNDVTICEQEETQLTATGAINYTWTPITGLSNATIANPIASPTATTKYFVTGVDGNGCENIDSVTVFVNPRPVALFEADTVCQGAVTTFTDLSTVATGTITDWSWDFGDGVGTSTLASPTYTYGTHGVFNVQLIVTSNLACSDTFNLNIQVDTLPLTNAGPDITYCFGDTAQINATGAATYIWTPAAGLSNPTIANPKVFVTTTTTYTVIGIGANGCFKSDRITVTVNPLPVIDAGNDLAVCLGDTVILGGIPTGPVGAKYTWTPSTQLNFDTVQNPICSPLITTMYYLEVEDGNACIARDSILVTVNPLPVVDAGVDTTMCKGDIVQLQASGAVTYSWSPIIGLNDPFISNPIAFPDTTTIYVVTGTDINGCFDTDTVIVEVFDVTIFDLEICEGESVELNPILSGDTVGITYLWSPAAGLNDATVRNPIANPLVRTKYFVEVRNAAGCFDVDSMIIEVKPNPIADFDLDFTPECSGLVTLVDNKSINGIDYRWVVNNATDTVDGFEPQLDFNFNSENVLTLIAQNLTCYDTLTKAINIGNIDNYLELVQSNVFSPNGDGINDVFRINYKGDLANCVEVTIFNRWGEIVYTSNTEKSGWDGRTQSGDKASPGTYFYVIDLQDAQVKGSVFLTR